MKQTNFSDYYNMHIKYYFWFYAGDQSFQFWFQN